MERKGISVGSDLLELSILLPFSHAPCAQGAQCSGNSFSSPHRSLHRIWTEQYGHSVWPCRLWSHLLRLVIWLFLQQLNIFISPLFIVFYLSSTVRMTVWPSPNESILCCTLSPLRSRDEYASLFFCPNLFLLVHFLQELGSLCS